MGLGDVASDTAGALVRAIADYDYSIDHKKSIVRALTHLIRLRMEADGFENVALAECRKEALCEWHTATRRLRRVQGR